MGHQLLSLKDADVRGKLVLVRLDTDVTLTTKGAIADDSRLLAALPTLEFLLKHHATVIGIGHLGRPQGIDQKYSLEPVAQWLEKKFKVQSSKFKMSYEQMGQFWGWKITDNLFLLENVRFYEEEEKNDTKFAKSLASLADIYVNDSFATSHRKHASIIGVPKFLPHYGGIHLQKEVEVLSSLLEHPRRPLVVVIGGAKIETKLPVVTRMHQVAEYVLVGGKIAQNEVALLHEQHKKIPNRKSQLFVADLNREKTDITPKSAENFLQTIALAKTIIWNGPLGFVESENSIYQQGTRTIAEGIVRTNAYKVVGGGDTIAYVKKIGLLDKFDFVSMGGGAMLEFLSGEKLPGIEALK